MVEIIRREQDHLLAHARHGQNRIHKPHVPPRRHYDALRIADANAILLGQLLLDGGNQFWNSVYGLVFMILPIGREACDRLHRPLRRAIIHNSLPQ